MIVSNLNIITLIDSLSKEHGFVDWGYTHVEHLQCQEATYMHSMHQDYFAQMEYLKRNLDKRFNPQLLVEGAKTIIMFLAPYGCTAKKGVASYALGDDYHMVIKDKLKKIFNTLIETTNEIDKSQPITGRFFTDSAPILERAWAVKSGLGFIGKNGLLISKKVGIRTLIGSIICNIELPKQSVEDQKNHCGNCTKCLDACPTGALCKPYILDSRKCISYNTIEAKYPDKFLNYNKWYYGCDECINACPWNSKNRKGWEQFEVNREIIENANPEWWRTLTKEEFNKLFKSSPLKRGGLNNILEVLQHTNN